MFTLKKLQKGEWMQNKYGPWSSACGSKLYQTVVRCLHSLYPPRARIHPSPCCHAWEAILQGLQQWLPSAFFFQLKVYGGESQSVRGRKENAVKVSTLFENLWLISVKDTAHVRSLWTVVSLWESCVQHGVVIGIFLLLQDTVLFLVVC